MKMCFSALAGLMFVAATPSIPDVSVTHARMHVLLPGHPVAGYFDLTNNGAADLMLTRAKSPGCGTLILHRSVNVSGTEHMNMVTQVKLRANGTLHFSPGGYHLMCTKPAPSVQPRRDVAVTLFFSGGRKVTTDFKIEGALGN